jgi:hypothetical protein
MRHLKKPSPAMIVACLSLFIALSGATYAATGGNFILGNPNTATSTTALTANIAGKALQLNNNSTGANATALGMSVASGKPPIITNSSTKVANLNADKIDGRDANTLVRAAGAQTSATTEVLQTTTVSYGGPLSITAPSAGFVIVNASITLMNASCAVTTGSECDVDGWVRHIQSGETSNVSQETVNDHLHNIAPASVFPVSAGVNTFDIRLHRAGNVGQIYGWFAEMNALFVPFGSTGTGTLGATATGSATKK